MRSLLFIFILVFVFSIGCVSQDEDLKNRKAVVAGAFYPGDKNTLKTDLEDLFSQAKENQDKGTVLAILAPHAGYPYSGIVAASSYNQVDPQKKYKNIFVMGSSHRAAFNGASIYNVGHYETPLGEVKVNLKLANKLISDNKYFTFNEYAHSQEHSLEVQMPFLQYRLEKDFKIVPVLLGTHAPAECYEIAMALYPWFNEDNLFIISADFSHYPDYENACKIDKLTAESIQSKSVEKFVENINNNIEKRDPALSTCICAWPAMLTMLYMINEDPDIEVNLIEYRNSGDADIGDKSRVVGYYSISFTRVDKTQSNRNQESQDMTTDQEFSLNDADKKALLEIARNTVNEYVLNRNTPEIDSEELSQNLLTPAGAFVTLNKDENLRGCIGRFSPADPLYKVVQDMAISSSTKDYRFSPVTPKELEDIEIEISVLTPMKKIESIEEIELGKHGIYIKQGMQSGTFLPQVATKTGWSLEEFLGHCAKDKAKIGWDGWKEAEIYTYEAIIFSEHDTH